MPFAVELLGPTRIIRTNIKKMLAGRQPIVSLKIIHIEEQDEKVLVANESCNFVHVIELLSPCLRDKLDKVSPMILTEKNSFSRYTFNFYEVNPINML